MNLAEKDSAVPADCHGLRLDQALTRMVPGLGRRGARRLWEHYTVLVNGQSRPAGYKVLAGEHIQMIPLEGTNRLPNVLPTETPQVVIANQNERFAALIKQAGMHSGIIAGSTGPSVQAVLPEVFPDLPAVLLNRLDQSVSGLVLVALNDRSVRDYAAWQDQGLVGKRYLAVVSGLLTEEVQIVAALDTAKRRKVHILAKKEADSLRWTRVKPLRCRERVNQSLVVVDISKGRRHQIRAHLASIGHPIIHDPLYGEGPDLGWIFLHHGSICLPGFSAVSTPCWDEWEVESVASTGLLPKSFLR